MRQEHFHFFKSNFFPKSCLYCGSFVGLVSANSYCVRCWSELKKKINPKKRRIKTPSGQDFLVLSLFDWIPKESDLLSEMILGLKGERQKRQWLFWSQQFLLHHNEFRQQGCFVSCWNKSSQPEHAEIFAQSLHRLRQKGGRLQNLRYHDVFQQSRRGLNFKKLGRKQRQNQLKDREIFSQKFHSTPSEKVIFVDDILTTGSTAEIAFLSLGKPPNFEVWSLAYRTNLAPF